MMRLPRRPSADWLALTAVTLMYLFVFLKLHQDWWFEDDTGHLGYLLDHPNPLFYFTKDGLVAFSYGRTVTPMLPLAFWVDLRLFGPSARAGYLHQGLATLLLVWLFYGLMLRFCRRPSAWITTVLMLLLPTTISVVEFLSTRHYVEGMVLTLAAWTAAVHALENDGRRTWYWVWAAAFLCFAAALCKEIFVTSGFLAPALWFLYKRRPALTVPGVLTGTVYAIYRIWSIGLTQQAFEGTAAFWRQYPAFLARLPYIFTGNVGGYAVALLVLVALVTACTKRHIDKPAAALWLLFTVIAMATVFPVSVHLHYGYQELGTWYRVGFFFNLVFLASGAWLVDRTPSPWLKILTTLILSVALGLGARAAATTWDNMKEAARREADFYLANPDKLLYSQLRAPWFMPGVQRVYGGDRLPHVIPHHMYLSGARERLARFDTLWVDGPNGFQPDQALYATVTWNVRDGVMPFHREVPAARRYHAPSSEEPTQIGNHLYWRDLELPQPQAVQSAYFWTAPAKANTTWFLLNPQTQSVIVRLTGYDHAGCPVGEQTVELAPGNAQSVPATEWPTLHHRAWQATAPISGLLLVDDHLHLGATPDTGFALPPIPRDQHAWQYQLRLLNPGDQTLEVTLAEDAQPSQRLRLPPHGGLVLPRPFDAAALQPRLEVGGGVLVAWFGLGYNQGPVLFSPIQQVAAGQVEAVLGDDAWQGLALGCAADRPVDLRLVSDTGRLLLQQTTRPGQPVLLGPTFVAALQDGARLTSDGPLVGYSLSLGEQGFRYQVLP